MATIAALAVKITANVSDVSKGLGDVVRSVDTMVKAAENATPNLKTLEDAVSALKPAAEAVNTAMGNVGTDWGGGWIDDQVDAFRKAEDGMEHLEASVKRLGSGVADDILKLKPTMENLFEAQKRLEQLKALQQQIAAEVVVDVLFFLQPNHCEESYQWEQDRMDLPIEYRARRQFADGRRLKTQAENIACITDYQPTALESKAKAQITAKRI